MVTPMSEPQQTVALMAPVALLPSQTNQNPTVFQLFLQKIRQHLTSAGDISPLYTPLLIHAFPSEMQGAGTDLDGSYLPKAYHYFSVN